MALSSVKHNKPVLPRTSDGSDLGSNRASIYSGKGLSFDGVNDEVSFGVLSLIPTTNDMAFSAYFSTTNTAVQYLFQNSSLYIATNRDSSGGAGNLSVYISSGSWIDTGVFVGDGNTHHLVVSLISGAVSIYLDGQLINSGSTRQYGTSGYNAFLGQRDGGSRWSGKISNLKWYTDGLTAAQVKELYDNPEQAVPTGVDATSLVLYLPMTEGAGSVVYNANAGAIGTELISNAGFDETCQKWGTTDDATVEIAGGKAIWTNAPLSGSFVEQPLDLEAGKFYRVSFDYTSTAFNLFVNLGDTQQAVPLGNGRYSYDMYYGTGNKSIKFQHGWTTTSSATVDNVSVKEVVPNYYNGTINGATWVSGLPEPLPQTALMDWNKGTNHFTKTDFSDTNVWTRNGVTLSTWYDEKSFEGQVFRLEENTTTSYHNLYHDGIALANHYYSVFAKAGSLDTLAFIEIATSPLPTVQFNLSTGVITETIGSNWDDYSMTDVGNGWYYLTAKYTGTSSKVHYNLIPKSGDANGIYSGGGSSNYLYVSSPSFSEYKNIFIPTYGTAQTSPVLIPEGSTAGKDVFGNTITNPRASGAYNFDGNSWAEVHDNGSLDITDEVTLECWLYHTDTTRLEHIIGKRASSGSWLRIYSAATNTLRVERDGGVSTSNVSITENAWSHIVATIDTSDVVRFYVNGTQETSKTSFTPWGLDNAAPVSIGAWVTENGAVSSNSYASGNIAQPRIYNYALTAEQVADNFNEKASTFGGTKVASELDAYIERTASDGATVEAHSCLVNYLTELDKK